MKKILCIAGCVLVCLFTMSIFAFAAGSADYADDRTVYEKVMEIFSNIDLQALFESFTRVLGETFSAIGKIFAMLFGR